MSRIRKIWCAFLVGHEYDYHELIRSGLQLEYSGVKAHTPGIETFHF
jgi:hypothetical protein